MCINPSTTFPTLSSRPFTSHAFLFPHFPPTFSPSLSPPPLQMGLAAAHLLQACGRRLAERQRASSALPAASTTGFPSLPAAAAAAAAQVEGCWGTLLSRLADWAGSEPRPLVADAATQVRERGLRGGEGRGGEQVSDGGCGHTGMRGGGEQGGSMTAVPERHVSSTAH